MALNVKAAMLICMGFIGGMSWVLQQFEAPRVEMPSPLAVAAARHGVGEAADGGGLGVSRDLDPRAVWVRQFARPNSRELQADWNRAADTNPGLAIAPPMESMGGGLAAAELPPLVYPAGDAAMVSVDEQPVVLASVLSPTEDAAAAVVAEPAQYRVSKGDTLTRIARRQWNSDDARLVALLVEANPKLRSRTARIVLGEELTIPPADAARRVLAGEAVAVVLARAVAGGSPSRGAAAETADPHWYTIRRNDTLAGIAQRLLKDAGRWREIAMLNRELNPRRIVPGMRIKLPPVLRLAQG